jgi:hypothetical protein
VRLVVRPVDEGDDAGRGRSCKRALPIQPDDVGGPRRGPGTRGCLSGHLLVLPQRGTSSTTSVSGAGEAGGCSSSPSCCPRDRPDPQGRGRRPASCRRRCPRDLPFGTAASAEKDRSSEPPSRVLTNDPLNGCRFVLLHLLEARQIPSSPGHRSAGAPPRSLWRRPPGLNRSRCSYCSNPSTRGPSSGPWTLASTLCRLPPGTRSTTSTTRAGRSWGPHRLPGPPASPGPRAAAEDAAPD